MKGSNILWIGGGIVLIYYLSQASSAAEGLHPGEVPPVVVPPGGRRTLKRGMRGDDVKALQVALNKITGFNLAVDGMFGKDTQNAVMQFQLSNLYKGLIADGIAGPKTLAALGI